jgi:hypothetical protein
MRKLLGIGCLAAGGGWIRFEQERSRLLALHPQQPQDLRFPTCVHEAAHAVFAFHKCGQRPKLIRVWSSSIVSADDDLVRIQGLTDLPGVPSTKETGAWISMLLAGPLAQYIYERETPVVVWRDPWPWNWVKEYSVSDFEQVESWLGQVDDAEHLFHDVVQDRLLRDLVSHALEIEQVALALVNNDFSLSSDEFLVALSPTYFTYLWSRTHANHFTKVNVSLSRSR